VGRRLTGGRRHPLRFSGRVNHSEQVGRGDVVTVLGRCPALQGPGGADCHTVREPHRAQGRHGIAATGQQRRQPTQPASRPSHGELGRLRPVGSHRSATAANDRRPSQRHEGPRLTRRVRSTRRQGGPGAQRKYLSSTPLVDRRRHCWRAGGRRPWCSPRWLRELAPFNTTDSNMRLYR